eukprot:10622285-Heterocapsa_arctica.AAC.1
MDHDPRRKQHGEADPGTRRQSVEGNGKGANGLRGKHAHAVPRCDDKRNARKSERKATHGMQVQCGGEQQ